MNGTLIYRPNSRTLTWIAFGCAITIHLTAIAIAENRSKPVPLVSWVEPEGPVDGIDPPPQPEEEPEIVPPQTMPEDQEFTDENSKRIPIHPRKKAPVTPIRSTNAGTGQATQDGSVKALTLYAPKPNYPYEARRGGITGSGVAQLTVNSAAGNVIEARMAQSTGNAILDRATVETLLRWRFRPGVASNVEVPIAYTLTGVSY